MANLVGEVFTHMRDWERVASLHLFYIINLTEFKISEGCVCVRVCGDVLIYVTCVFHQEYKALSIVSVVSRIRKFQSSCVDT